MIIIANILPAEVPWIWKDAEPYLQSAVDLSRGEMTIDDIREMCARGMLFLAVAKDLETGEIYGALVSEVRQYTRKKSLSVPYLGGKELQKWRKQLGAFLILGAKNIGADFIEAFGRKGWAGIWDDLVAVRSDTVTTLEL